MSLIRDPKSSIDETSQSSIESLPADAQASAGAAAARCPISQSADTGAQPGNQSTPAGAALLPAADVDTRPWQRRVSVVWLAVIGVVTLVLATGGAWLLLSDKRLDIRIALVDRRPTPTPIAAPTMIPGARILPVTVTPTAVVPLATPSATMTQVTPPQAASPTALPAAEPALLSQAQTTFQVAVERRDRAALEQALDMAGRAETADGQSKDRLSALRRRIYYAMDALNGTVYLSEDNSARYDLVRPDGQSLVNPIDLTIGPGSLYLIDSGTVYSASLGELKNRGRLTLTTILSPTADINGYPVKEAVALDATNTGGPLFVLDKSGDLYRHDIISRTWQLINIPALQYTNPDPNFLNITTWSDRLYILDPARNQVWRDPANQHGDGFLPGKLPWLLKPQDPDVSDGIDLAVDGATFVLRRDGTIDRYFYDPSSGFQPRRFDLAEANARSHVVEMEVVTPRPVAIFAAGEGVPLYVADPARRRVVAIHRQTGAFLRQFAAPDNADFGLIHGVAERDGRLYVLAGPRVYGIDVGRGITATLPLTGELPIWQAAPSPAWSTLHVTDLASNDPRVPALIATRAYTMPIRGASLPDRPAIYPGARRAYRYGVHEGLDLYRADVGTEVKVGTPVYAAGEGRIVRADTNYVEMTLDEINGLLDASNAGHNTPPATLSKLGGRQVWIDHGDGISTRYLHLNAVAEGITVTTQVKMGDLIGYVGLSGTPDGIAGDTRFTHLHFEFRVGQGDQAAPLGQWLTIEDARRAYELILKTPVRPAYLEELPWKSRK